MKLALDTNRYSDSMRGDPAVVQQLASAAAVLMPFIVIAELRCGFLQGSRGAENERRLQRFLGEPNVGMLFADDQTTLHYARLNEQLRRAGTPLPIHDVWIAALCIQHNLPLFSRDAHFDHLPQLVRV